MDYFNTLENKRLELVESYISLTKLFPQNGCLENDVELITELKCVTNVYPSRACSLLDIYKVWNWIPNGFKPAAVYLKENLYKIMYSKWGAGNQIKGILEDLTQFIKLVNLCAKNIFELRNEVGTRDISANENDFLMSLYDTLYCTIKFLQFHSSDNEVFLLTKLFCTEKRPHFSIDAIHLTEEEIDTSNLSTCIKSIEILLSMCELTACASLEFGFRITYSELLRSAEESCSYGEYFSERKEELSQFRVALQTTWDYYNRLLLKPNDEKESTVFAEIAIADKFSREYKLWKNSNELGRIGNTMVEEFNTMSELSKILVQNTVPFISQSAIEDDKNFRQECEDDIRSLIKQSFVKLSKLKKLSCVNEEIIKAMQKASCSNKHTSTLPILQTEMQHEAADSCSDNEVFEDAFETVYEHGQDDLAFNLADEDPLGKQSKPFEVYQLRERTNSEEDIEGNETIYEWEEDAKEIKATHKFVMSELKEVLVGVKDVMSKREKEAFRDKYGYEEPTDDDAISENPMKEDNFEGGGDCTETELQSKTAPDSILRKRKTVICLANECGDNDGGAANSIENMSIGNGVNLMTFARPNFAPLVDEYIINDEGSDLEDECEDN